MIELPLIPETERTALIEELVRLIETLAEQTQQQTETIQQLRDEIARLKGEKGKPRFKPSGMEQKAGQGDEQQEDADTPQGTRKRPGSSKRAKTAQLTVHEDCRIPPSQPPPPGSRFKGYRDVVVQDLKIQAHTTRYRLEVWQTPDGEWLCGELPSTLQGGHFGTGLRAYVLYQYHHCHVTQPLLREQ